MSAWVLVTTLGCLTVGAACVSGRGAPDSSGGGGASAGGGAPAELGGSWSDDDTNLPPLDEHDNEPDVHLEPGENCYDESNIWILVPLELAAYQGLCASDQLEAIHAACVSSTTSSAMSCAVVLDDPTNQPCAACLGLAEDDITNHPVLVRDPWSEQLWPNTPACEAVTQGKEYCAQSAAEFALCSWTACVACSEDDLGSCQIFAGNQLCHSWLPDAECQSLLPPPGMESPECVGEDISRTFMKVAAVLCGAPP